MERSGGGIFRSVRPALVELLSTARDRPDAPALHSNSCSSRVKRLSSRNQHLLLSSASASRVLAAYVAERLPESHGRKFYRMRRFFGAAVFIYRMSAWGQKQKVKGTVSESAFAACFRCRRPHTEFCKSITARPSPGTTSGRYRTSSLLSARSAPPTGSTPAPCGFPAAR